MSKVAPFKQEKFEACFNLKTKTLISNCTSSNTIKNDFLSLLKKYSRIVMSTSGADRM